MPLPVPLKTPHQILVKHNRHLTANSLDIPFLSQHRGKLLKTVVAEGSMPPVAAKTNGGKASSLHLQNFFIISLSFLLFINLIAPLQ